MDNTNTTILEEYKQQIFNRFGYIIYEALDIDKEYQIADAVVFNETILAFGFALKPDGIVELAKRMDSINDVIRSASNLFGAEELYSHFSSIRDELLQRDEVGVSFRAYEKYYDDRHGITMSNSRIEEWTYLDTTNTSEYKYKNAHIVTMIPTSEAFLTPMKNIICRGMEISNKPDVKNIVFLAAQELDRQFFMDNPIREKTVLREAFYGSFCKKDYKKCFIMCKSASSVFWCIRQVLNKKKFSLKTSEKRVLSNLIDSIDSTELEMFFMESRTRQLHIIKTLEFLSYNRFSRNRNNKDIIYKLRNNEIRTVKRRVNDYIQEGSEQVLDYLCLNPKLFISSIRLLLKNGYEESSISKRFQEIALKLESQHMISVINSLISEGADRHIDQIINIITTGLMRRFERIHSELNERKVYINAETIDIEKAIVMSSNQDKEIRTGSVVKLPYDEIVRLFVRWNANEHTDINLEYLTTDDCSPQSVQYSGDSFGDVAEEYIDIDMSTQGKVSLAVEVYKGKLFFSLNNCVIGATIVDKATGKNTEPIFLHELKYKSKYIDYGVVDIDENRLYINARPLKTSTKTEEKPIPWGEGLSYKDLIEIICKAKKCIVTDNRCEADFELLVGTDNLRNSADTRVNKHTISLCDFM